MARTKLPPTPEQERAAAKKLLQIVRVFADDPKVAGERSGLMVLRRCIEHFWEGPHETGPYQFSPNYREHYFWSCAAVDRAIAIDAAPNDSKNRGHSRGLVKEHVVPFSWISAALLTERQEGRLKTPNELRGFLRDRFVIAVVTKAQDSALDDVQPSDWNLNASSPDNIWKRYKDAAQVHPDLELDRFMPYREHCQAGQHGAH